MAVNRGTVRTDPLRNFKFQIHITKDITLQDGRTVAPVLARAGFMSVGGLGIQTEVIPYREGGMNTHTRKLPGQSDFPPITLNRGMFDASGGKHGDAFWGWFKEIFFVNQGLGFGPVGNDFRTDFYIRVMGHPVTQGPGSNVDLEAGGTEEGARLMFKVYNAWPSSLAMSDLDAGGNAIMVEQVVLAHEGFEPIFATDSATGLAATF